MAVYNCIHGVWRKSIKSNVNINGVWRSTKIHANINGMWRSVPTTIYLNDISYFKIVYQFSYDQIDPLHPHLVTNKNIPFEFDRTGESQGINTSTKGVIYYYLRRGTEEGIAMYKGSLYMILNNGEILSLSQMDEMIPEDLSIQIYGYTFTYNIGYISGWNSMFDSIDNINSGYGYMNPRIILPVSKRNSTYSTSTSIGISRNISKPDHNMLGSEGTLDHTIYSIEVNGIKKPFEIEIID